MWFSRKWGCAKLSDILTIRRRHIAHGLLSGGDASRTYKAGEAAQRLAQPAGGPHALVDSAGPHSDVTATAARRGAQPRPILVKGDLRRFPTPPGVDDGPLRIQACLSARQLGRCLSDCQDWLEVKSVQTPYKVAGKLAGGRDCRAARRGRHGGAPLGTNARGC